MVHAGLESDRFDQTTYDEIVGEFERVSDGEGEGVVVNGMAIPAGVRIMSGFKSKESLSGKSI